MMRFFAMMAVVVFCLGQPQTFAFSEALMDKEPHGCLIDLEAVEFGLIWEGNCHGNKATGLGTVTFIGGGESVATITGVFVEGAPDGIVVVNYNGPNGKHNVCALEWGADIKTDVCWSSERGAYRGNLFK